MLRRVADQLIATVPGDMAIQSAANALHARLDMLESNPRAAIGRLRRAISFKSRLDTPTRLPEWYLLLAQSDAGASSAHISSAYRALESLRPVMPARDELTEESTLALRMRGTFQKEVSIRLTALAASKGGIGEVQEVIEAYREAEIASVLGDDCVPPSPTPISPTDLARNELILYPIVLEDRLELLYARGTDKVYKQIVVKENVKDGDRIVQRDVVGAEVAALARDLRENVAGTELGGEWRKSAHKLYQYLIAPIETKEPDLFRPTGGEKLTVVVIPDGPLRGRRWRPCSMEPC